MIYNAIHFLWHVLHLDVFPTIDKFSVAGILGGLLSLSILLTLPVKETKPSPSVRLSEVAAKD